MKMKCSKNQKMKKLHKQHSQKCVKNKNKIRETGTTQDGPKNIEGSLRHVRTGRWNIETKTQGVTRPK